MTVRSFLTALRCNPRHHGLALVAAAEPMLYHSMLEARTLDDVGYPLDRHHDTDTPISMGIGKHTNDHMVSAWLGDAGRRVATVIE